MPRNERNFEIMIKILFVCHGNICRSTMAESVFTYLINQRGLSDYFEIDSAATSREEIGNPPHYGTVTKLRQVGIPVVPHRSRQMTTADYEYYDYLIGMDSANIRNMNRIAGGDPDGRFTSCHLLRDVSETSQTLGIQANLKLPTAIFTRVANNF